MTVISWDYKDNPDWIGINAAIEDTPRPRCFGVETGTDQFAVVVGTEDDTPEEAQRFYDLNP